MIKRYFEKLQASIRSIWSAVKSVQYKRLLLRFLQLLEALPGLLAWAFEVTSLITAAIFITLAARSGLAGQLWTAGALIILAALLVVVCVLADHYAQPSDDKHGGGS